MNFLKRGQPFQFFAGKNNVNNLGVSVKNITSYLQELIKPYINNLI
jgi:hypothetical protein